jgi:hypothetical protein
MSGSVAAVKVAPLQALRAFSVMLGGSLVLLAGLAGAVAWIAASLLDGEAPAGPAVAVVAVAVLYLTLGRRWIGGWGASREERERSLPGDEPGTDPRRASTRAVTIAAPPEAVWPWLAQIGQDRGGFYSYEWLENLAGCRMRNADRIHPEWQRRRIGEKVLLHPAVGLEVSRFEPGRVLALRNWGTWVLEPAGDGGTRLIARGRELNGPEAPYYVFLLELPHFIMERKMLLGIKRRAERGDPPVAEDVAG